MEIASEPLRLRDLDLRDKLLRTLSQSDNPFKWHCLSTRYSSKAPCLIQRRDTWNEYRNWCYRKGTCGGCTIVPSRQKRAEIFVITLRYRPTMHASHSCSWSIVNFHVFRCFFLLFARVKVFQRPVLSALILILRSILVAIRLFLLKP